ncbi:MAG: SBBP repeat-containing protein, partial [Candidatus Paceibacterota bacterium]
MKTILLFAIFFLFLGNAYSEPGLSYNWTNSVGGADYERATAVTTDKNGNIYVVGSYDSDNMDFDPGVGVDIHVNKDTHEVYTSSDVFLSKYDENGNYLWTKTFGGISNDYGHAVAVDEDDYVYVSGQFAETVDFDPGPGEVLRTAGHFDSYVSRFSPNGVHIWTKTWGGVNYDTANLLT